MRFVIIASPRTGSSHLTTQLARAAEIWCHDEVFHKDGVFVRWPGAPDVKAPEGLERELRALRAVDPDRFLTRIYALGFDRAHVGLRIFEHHHPLMLAKIIADEEIAKIVLIRANVLANYASELAALETGIYGKRSATAPLVRFDPDNFRRHFDRYMNFYAATLAQLNASGQAYQLVRYDELNNPQLLEKLVRFFGTKSWSAPTPGREHLRGSPDVLSRFSNSDQTRQFLHAHGRLEWEHEGELSFSPLASNLRDGTSQTA